MTEEIQKQIEDLEKQLKIAHREYEIEGQISLYDCEVMIQNMLHEKQKQAVQKANAVIETQKKIIKLLENQEVKK